LASGAGTGHHEGQDFADGVGLRRTSKGGSPPCGPCPASHFSTTQS
jgi:hypothetical protein